MSYSLSGSDDVGFTFKDVAEAIIAKILSVGIPGFKLGDMIPNDVEPVLVQMVANFLAQTFQEEMNLKDANTDAVGDKLADEILKLSFQEGYLDPEEDKTVATMLHGMLKTAISDALENIVQKTTGLDPTKYEEGPTPGWSSGVVTGPATRPGIIRLPGDLVGPAGPIREVSTGTKMSNKTLMLLGAAAVAALVLLKK